MTLTRCAFAVIELLTQGLIELLDSSGGGVNEIDGVVEEKKVESLAHIRLRGGKSDSLSSSSSSEGFGVIKFFGTSNALSLCLRKYFSLTICK
jgi:hypothetical protein